MRYLSPSIVVREYSLVSRRLHSEPYPWVGISKAALSGNDGEVDPDRTSYLL